VIRHVVFIFPDIDTIRSVSLVYTEIPRVRPSQAHKWNCKEFYECTWTAIKERG
jgi:hypothetical protein